MPKHRTVEPYLPLDEREQRCRRARDPVLRSHDQLSWLVAQHHPTRDIAAVTGYSPDGIRTIRQRDNADGPTGLGERRQHNPGAQGLLSDTLQAALAQALEGPPAAGEGWTARTVAAWMSPQLGQPVHRQRGWDELRTLGSSCQRPRPRYVKAEAAAQETDKQHAPSS
jgi:transposase